MTAKMRATERALGRPLKAVLSEVLEASGSYREACERLNAQLEQAGAETVALPTFITWCYRLGLRAVKRMVVAT